MDPPGNRGHVLITTRFQFTGKLAQGLDLPKMTPDEGARFLIERGRIQNPNAGDFLAAKNIAEEFGGLPLGLEQAGAYIEEAKLSPAEYLELYRREGKKLRARGGAIADHETVTVTFTLAFERLGESARKIVRMAAFLAPDAIPEEVLVAGKQPDMEFRDAVADGVRFSLIQRNSATQTIEIHRLVQEVVKDSMDLPSQRDWIERSAIALNQSFPEEIDFTNWPICERLLPHARVVAAEILRHSMESEAGARLLHQTEWYLEQRAEYSEGEPLIRRALEIREKVLGQHHPDIAKSLNNLAMLYEKQGHYEEAEPPYKRALEINEKALGAEHPDTATSLNNLAETYERQGQHKEAEPLYERALEIYERSLGPSHPNTAAVLSNLGGLYLRQGRHKEVEPMYKRALEINERALGLDHPRTATSLNNLAALYESQGRSEEAEPMYQRALEIREKALGPDHPDTANPLNNLAGLYNSQGRAKEAELLYKRALEIREKVLGPDHPDTAASLNNLATLYVQRGRFLEADPLLRRALAVAEKTLGAAHPDTRKLADTYSQVLQKLGRSYEAHKLRERFKKGQG